jgi:hypothetical protein
MKTENNKNKQRDIYKVGPCIALDTFLIHFLSQIEELFQPPKNYVAPTPLLFLQHLIKLTLFQLNFLLKCKKIRSVL